RIGSPRVPEHPAPAVMKTSRHGGAALVHNLNLGVTATCSRISQRRSGRQGSSALLVSSASASFKCSVTILGLTSPRSPPPSAPQAKLTPKPFAGISTRRFLSPLGASLSRVSILPSTATSFSPPSIPPWLALPR